MHWKFKMFSVSYTVSWVLFQTLLSRYRRLIVNNVFNFYVRDWIPVTSRNMLLKLILQIRKEKKRFETTFKFSPIQSTTGNITETTVAHKSCTISIHYSPLNNSLSLILKKICEKSCHWLMSRLEGHERCSWYLGLDLQTTVCLCLRIVKALWKYFHVPMMRCHLESFFRWKE